MENSNEFKVTISVKSGSGDNYFEGNVVLPGNIGSEEIEVAMDGLLLLQRDRLSRKF